MVKIWLSSAPPTMSWHQQIDAVLDLVGDSTILDPLAMLRRGGRACLAGWLGGLAPIADFNPLLQMASGVYLCAHAARPNRPMPVLEGNRRPTAGCADQWQRRSVQRPAASLFDQIIGEPAESISGFTVAEAQARYHTKH
jgi:NADPH:quinone reductase-like Zn-dependent oxidoreductase